MKKMIMMIKMMKIRAHKTITLRVTYFISYIDIKNEIQMNYYITTSDDSVNSILFVQATKL